MEENFLMRYGEVLPAEFLARPNRFIAHVLMQGEEVVCHVKNTGRCRELLRPGARVWLERGTAPKRKTAFDLIAVQKGGRLVNMDAQAPNRIFGEWAMHLEPGIQSVRPEVFFEDSRLDFLLDTEGGKHYVEVKGVTLESGGHVRFPDAPTERGVRHLHTLMRAVEQGHRATAFFVVQMADVLDFSPNDETHPAFGLALRQAAAAGVQVLAYSCRVTPEEVVMDRPIPVIL